MRAACRHSPASVSTSVRSPLLQALEVTCCWFHVLGKTCDKASSLGYPDFEAPDGLGGGSARQLSCAHEALRPVLPGCGH